MKVSPEKIEVPDACGDFCPIYRKWGRKFPMMDQGDTCSRCPIFNCCGEEPLIEPEDYRSDWADYYVEWWNTNKKEKEKK